MEQTTLQLNWVQVVSIGDKMLGLNATADGDVVTAYADNELDIYLSGEVCAAFYEGDIEGGFTFLGLEIEITLGGFAGGAGIGGTVGIIDNKAKVEVLGGLGLGGKIGVSIGLAD